MIRDSLIFISLILAFVAFLRIGIADCRHTPTVRCIIWMNPPVEKIQVQVKPTNALRCG